VILVEEFPALVLGECCVTRNICFDQLFRRRPHL
jgi:hypothetical protein